MNTNYRKKVAIVSCTSYNLDCVITAIDKIMDLIKDDLPDISAEDKILLKPNLCLPESPEKAITTHPSIIEAVYKWISRYSNFIFLGDSPVGEATLERQELIYKTTEIENLLYRNIDLQKLKFHENLLAYETVINSNKIEYYLPKEIENINYIVNMPKFKTHSLMTFTGAVKNLYGLLPGTSKKSLHFLLPNKYDFAELQIDICNRVKPAINIMDAVYGIEGEGPGKRGSRRYIGCLLASTDAFALDIVCSMLLNIPNEYIPINALAIEKGFSVENIEIVGDNIKNFIAKGYNIPKGAFISRNEDKYISRIFKMAKEKVQFDEKKCQKCKLCIDTCPAEALSFDQKVIADQSKCIGCKTCVEICPVGAVEVKNSKLYKQIREVGS